MNLRNLRQMLKTMLGVSWEDATKLAVKFRYIPYDLLMDIAKDPTIKKDQHPNYYVTIMWKKLNDYLAHGGGCASNIKDLIAQILDKKTG